MRRWPGAAVMLLVVMLAVACGSGRGGSTAAHKKPAAVAQVAQAHPSASPTPKPSHRATPTLDVHRTLKIGMSGADVRQVQRRLAALKYYPGPADGRYGQDTVEAVWAFQEVQGLRPSPSGEVGRAMLHALAHPRAPKILVRHGAKLRVEVNLAHEVLVLYKGGKPALISHVSSGGGYYFCSPGGGCGYAVTPTGDYRTITFMPGWVTVPLGEMYNPVFFIGHAYAIHGDTDVPLEPASHGCVRIPMDIAAFFHKMLPDTGTPVYLRG